MAKHQARVAADQITGKSDAALWDRADGAGAPRVTFTEPQVAAVGLTEQTARDAGIDVQIVSVGTSANAGGTLLGRKSDSVSGRRVRRVGWLLRSGNAVERLGELFGVGALG